MTRKKKAAWRPKSRRPDAEHTVPDSESGPSKTSSSTSGQVPQVFVDVKPESSKTRPKGGGQGGSDKKAKSSAHSEGKPVDDEVKRARKENNMQKRQERKAAKQAKAEAQIQIQTGSDATVRPADTTEAADD